MLLWKKKIMREDTNLVNNYIKLNPMPPSFVSLKTGYTNTETLICSSYFQQEVAYTLKGFFMWENVDY